MTRSIEALTPLERKQFLERLEWMEERGRRKYIATCVTSVLLGAQIARLFSKLTPSESDELDNCVL